jgi:uncharacterized repeat protein (TIGR03803 family)
MEKKTMIHIGSNGVIRSQAGTALWLRRVVSRKACTSSHLAVALVLVYSLAAAWSPAATAQSLTTLYNFTGGSDGLFPAADLARDRAGNLYGVATRGGSGGSGVVFKLSPAGTQTVLYNFTGGVDGAEPNGGLVRDAQGNLYGTTANGGSFGGPCDPFGCGTVFKVTPDGQETVLYTFTGGLDGARPFDTPVLDAHGNLYLNTDNGTVIEVAPGGAFTIFHTFHNSKDGIGSEGSMVRDGKGNLYGATLAGGTTGNGTVFAMTPSGNTTVLYNQPFSPTNGGLTRDANGNLYGTTIGGGTNGGGTIFKIAPDGTATTIWNFDGGTDGFVPHGGLIVDGQGRLYGTTPLGGANNAGTVFELASDGSFFKVLHTFTGGADGGNPSQRVSRDNHGNLYGTTGSGGVFGQGTVFRLTP